MRCRCGRRDPRGSAGAVGELDRSRVPAGGEVGILNEIKIGPGLSWGPAPGKREEEKES